MALIIGGTMKDKRTICNLPLKYIVLVLAFTTLLPVIAAAAVDSYAKLAKELSEGASELTNRKIAILPFAYVDNRESSGGMIIAERLTTRIIKLKKFTVIERSLLDKVVGELKLQISGVIDPDSAKELGKVLGVEAIIAGSLLPAGTGKVEINARLIRTETAEAIVASSVIVDQDWEGAPGAAAPYKPGQPAYTQQPQVMQYGETAGPAGGSYSFVDFFTGYSTAKMDLRFERSKKMYANWVYVNIVDDSDYIFTSISWTDLETHSSIPFGLRIGGFSGIIGGDIEISYGSHNIVPQEIRFDLDGVDFGDFTFTTDDYLTVKSLLLGGDLLMRIPIGIVDPYFGIGAGFTFNSIESPYLKGYTKSTTFSSPTKDTEVGFNMCLPVGLRIRMGNDISLFVEVKWYTNMVSFDRDITDEDDSLNLESTQLLAGLSVLF